MILRSWPVLSLALLLAAAPAVTLAQDPVYQTRAQLQRQLESLRSGGPASGESGRASDVRQRIAAIELRLREGDFQPGDVVDVRVLNVQDMSGQFTVNQSRALEVPTLEEPISLEGVLYAEADSVIQEELSVYVRDPRVRVRPLRRVAVLGGVNKPGFYDVPPSTTLSEMLMRAGGPTGRAKVDEVEFRRGDRDLLEGRDRERVYQLSLADLGPSRGDQIYVPQSGDGITFMGVLGIVSGVSGTAWALARIF